MKSCFSPLRGAGLWSAQSQLCERCSLVRPSARPLMFTGGGKTERAEGWREAEEGWNYSKMNYTSGIPCFLQHGKIYTVVRESVSSYQTPVCFILEIVLPFQLP